MIAIQGVSAARSSSTYAQAQNRKTRFGPEDSPAAPTSLNAASAAAAAIDVAAVNAAPLEAPKPKRSRWDVDQPAAGAATALSARRSGSRSRSSNRSSSYSRSASSRSRSRSSSLSSRSRSVDRERRSRSRNRSVRGRRASRSTSIEHKRRSRCRSRSAGHRNRNRSPGSPHRSVSAHCTLPKLTSFTTWPQCNRCYLCILALTSWQSLDEQNPERRTVIALRQHSTRERSPRSTMRLSHSHRHSPVPKQPDNGIRRRNAADSEAHRRTEGPRPRGRRSCTFHVAHEIV